MQHKVGVSTACDGLASGNTTVESSLASTRNYGRLASCSFGADAPGDTCEALSAELMDAVGGSGSVRLPVITAPDRTHLHTSYIDDLAAIQPLPSPSPEPLGVTALLAELQAIGVERAMVRSLAATPEFLAEEIWRVEDRDREHHPAASQNRSAASGSEQRAAAMYAAQQSFLPRLLNAEAFRQRASPRHCKLSSMRKAAGSVREDGWSERTTLPGGFAWSRKAVDRAHDEGSSLGWRVARTRGTELVSLQKRRSMDW